MDSTSNTTKAHLQSSPRTSTTGNQDADSRIPNVSQLTRRIKDHLESRFSDIRVEGELSNVKQSRNGHYYFTVKDQRAQLPCVLWQSTAGRLSVEPADGQQVILGGDLQVYAPHGRYQLVVTRVEQAGAGRLQQAFEALREKLKQEGLFDPGHKKPLPKFPEKIGVLTSSTGAALQDILSTLQRRWPLAQVYLHHTTVQGVQAAGELTKGLHYFSTLKQVDLLIMGRGGGSLEDLWPFNEEGVARAIHKCPIPVISAVGHETDFSISDFVADVRAATPTQAAVLATPDINEIRLLIEEISERIHDRLCSRLERYQSVIRQLGSSHPLLVVRDRLQHHQRKLANLREGLQFRMERLQPGRRERLSELHRLVEERTRTTFVNYKDSLKDLIHRLEKKDPHLPLSHGFVRVWQNGKWIRRPNDLKPQDSFELEWEKKRKTIRS